MVRPRQESRPHIPYLERWLLPSWCATAVTSSSYKLGRSSRADSRTSSRISSSSRLVCAPRIAACMRAADSSSDETTEAADGVSE
eukprot:scaffold82124_cov39-Tisochrysis_lutea.AAC.1